MKSLVVSAAALVDQDGRVLIAQRPEGKTMAGLWEFPGGKIEKGESPETALVRELEEELGINTWASCLAPLSFATYKYEQVNLLLLLFVCHRWEKSVQSKENQSLKWVYPMDMSKC